MSDVLDVVNRQGLLHSRSDVDKWAGYLKVLCTTMPLVADTPYAMSPTNLKGEAKDQLHGDITLDQATAIYIGEMKHCQTVG
jgi:hypothetical protein